MAHKFPAAQIDNFCRKLEQFSAGLSDEERTMFKHMFDRGGLSDDDLGQVTGGGAPPFTLQYAPPLQATFFRTMF